MLSPSSLFSFKAKAKGRPFLSWIYAPTLEGFYFSLRTTIAACVALGIAFWLELDSPAWAAMTVWSVAQLNRGESLSKARWRMIGTTIGACAAVTIMALTPQQPWLFFPLIALWIGLCSGYATFVSNFRSYAFVLAGYTCSIICTDAAPNGNNVFIYAVSRFSYIILGVLCESLIAFLFSYNQERNAHIQMKKKLEQILITVSSILRDILTQKPNALIAARKQFGALIKANDEIEFTEIEMGAHGHEGDHARAALAAISALLSRGLGMATRLKLLTHEHPDLETITHAVLEFLKEFPQRLPIEAEISELLAELQHLRDLCRQYASPHRITTFTRQEPHSSLTPQILHQLQDENRAEIITSDLDERVLFFSLGELLGDLEHALTEYHASIHTILGDRFQFNRKPHFDGKLAFHNGIRGTITILITALIYEVTAWPQGLKFIGMTSLICGLYATRENPVLATLEFLKGTIAAWCVAWFLVFYFIPLTHSYEALIFVLGIAMFLGGLAKVNPSTAGYSASYNLLMPSMLGLQNHHIMSEVSFYNDNLATLLAAAISVIVFRTILPFNAQDERFRLRKAMLVELRQLANPHYKPNIAAWIDHSTDRLSCLLRHAGPIETPFIESCIQGTLSSLTLGLNIIRLRHIMNREYLPESAHRPIELVLHYIEVSTHQHDKIARVAHAAIRRLRELDTNEHDIITRLELTRAITYLVVVAHVLKKNVNFLNMHQLFKGENI